MNRCFVTTSWDDGHPHDQKVADILAHYGLKGTFYIPGRNTRPICDKITIGRLASSGFELGGHTLSHCHLGLLSDDEALAEICDGKAWLEDQIGAPITSFCYPKGKAPARVRRLVPQAGFQRARTTKALCTDPGYDSFSIPVTVQLYPHVRTTHLRHAVKEANWTGLHTWSRWGFPSHPIDILRRAIEHVERKGGVIHLWGHSWEIDACGLWEMLTDAAALLGHRPGWVYATNADIDRMNHP